MKGIELLTESSSQDRPAVISTAAGKGGQEGDGHAAGKPILHAAGGSRKRKNSTNSLSEEHGLPEDDIAIREMGVSRSGGGGVDEEANRMQLQKEVGKVLRVSHEITRKSRQKTPLAHSDSASQSQELQYNCNASSAPGSAKALALQTLPKSTEPKPEPPVDLWKRIKTLLDTEGIARFKKAVVAIKNGSVDEQNHAYEVVYEVLGTTARHFGDEGGGGGVTLHFEGLRLLDLFSDKIKARMFLHLSSKGMLIYFVGLCRQREEERTKETDVYIHAE
jgi:hypothetical protein